ncbi:MAG: hypothetical protein ABWY20_08715 [Mycobacterium sp.]
MADPHRPSRRHQRARGSPTPQRRHNAITDRQPYPGYFCDLPTATQRGDIGRVYHNPTESVPDRRPARRTPQVPRDRDDWIPIDCPASSPTGCSRPPATFATDNTKWSSRRAVAGQWQRRRLLTRVDPNDNRQQGQLQQGLANVLDGASSRAGTAIRLADVHYNRVDVHRDNLAPDEVDISVGSFQESSEYGVPVAMGPPPRHSYWVKTGTISAAVLRGGHFAILREPRDTVVESIIHADNRLITGRLLRRVMNPTPTHDEAGWTCYGLWRRRRHAIAFPRNRISL